MVESRSVQSVARAIELLEHLASADGDVALADLARRTGLQPPTAHRLLQTLVQREWVVQNPATSRYRLSHKLTAIAGDIEVRTARLRAVARPHLELLRDETGESTNLVVLDGLAAVYVDQVPALRPIRMFTEIGARVPAYASGAGKAMLAHQPRAVLDKLGRSALKPLTPRTITDLAALRRELDRTRKRGYALDNEEYETGVICMAAPILASADIADAAATALAAISVSAPAARLRAMDREDLGLRLSARGRAVSRELGYAPATG